MRYFSYILLLLVVMGCDIPMNAQPIDYKTVNIKQTSSFRKLSSYFQDGNNGLKKDTRFIVRKNHDLCGETLTLGEDCILDFQGGCFYNGTIVFDNTKLTGQININCDFKGTVKNSVINVLDFGADNTNTVDASPVIQQCIDLGIASSSNVYIPKGTYALKSWIQSFRDYYKKIDDIADVDKYKDFHNITIYGDGYNTILNGAFPDGHDIINIYCSKNFVIRDLAVTGGPIPLSGRESGINIISIVYGANIEFNHVKVYGGSFVEKTVYNDGGDGISFQGDGGMFQNLRVLNCDIYDCDNGIALQFRSSSSTDPRTSVIIQGCTIEECNYGLFVDFGREEWPINAPLYRVADIQANTINCFHSLYCDTPGGGINVDVRVNNDETVDGLNTRPDRITKWNTIGGSKDGDFEFDAYAAFLYGCNYSNINLNIQAKELNHVVMFDSDVRKRGGMLLYNSNKNNRITIIANDDISIVKNIAHSKIQTRGLAERKIYVANSYMPHHPMFTNSVIEFLGFSDSYIGSSTSSTDAVPDVLKKLGNNNVIIVDGNIYSEKYVGNVLKGSK